MVWPLNRVESAMYGAMNTFAAPNSLYAQRPGMEALTSGLSHRQRYAMLDRYYRSVDLYENLALLLKESGIWKEPMKPLRNPTHAAVEFYPATLWAGSLEEVFEIVHDPRPGADAPLDSDNDKLIPAIDKIYQWSNWQQNKQEMARNMPRYGDQFLQAATRKRRNSDEVIRSYINMIDPMHVSDFDKDERGFMTYIRLDIPKTRRQSDGKKVAYVHTEVWDKDSGLFRLWETPTERFRYEEDNLDRLGTPVDEQYLEQMGIDFVPFSHGIFRSIGDERGEALIMPCIDKIDEINRSATRLHQQIFRNNKVTWVVAANMLDAANRPMPAPRMGEANSTITVGDDEMYFMPGMSSMEPMVPDLHYAEHLAILKDGMEHLEDYDLPELRYYQIHRASADSGVALRYLLTAAIDRVIEARGNADSAVVQVTQMALTLAQVNGIPGFESERIGTFEAGDFEHHFERRDVIATSASERAQTEYTRAQGAVLKKQYGYSNEQLWREAGLNEMEIDQMRSEAEREQRENPPTVADAMIDRFNRGEEADE
jgi:hypothetical protein